MKPSDIYVYLSVASGVKAWRERGKVEGPIMLTRCAVAKHHEDIVIKYRRAHFEASEIGECKHVRLPGLEPGSTRL